MEVQRKEIYITPDGITHDTIAVKSIISWEGEKKWLLATRWDITQLKNYERELVAAKEELEKALKKQKLALKSIDFGLIYIDNLVIDTPLQKNGEDLQVMNHVDNVLSRKQSNKAK